MTFKVRPNRNKGLVMLRSGRTFLTREIANAKIPRREEDWCVLGTKRPVCGRSGDSQQGSVGDGTRVL